MPEAEPKLFEFHAGAARELSIPGGPAGLERCLQFLPDRVYEALRTRGEARFFRLEQHCARAEQGCASAGLPPFDEDAFRQGLDATTRAYGHEAKVRIEVPKKLSAAQRQALEAFAKTLGDEPAGEKSFWQSIADLLD